MNRILIVEDEARIESFLRRALTSCGFDVDSVGASEPALAACKRVQYDLVLLDLLLPGLDGFTFLEQIYELRPDQEVLVLSALSDVESKVRCFELGAADYVTKPFVLAELIARIRTRVRHGKAVRRHAVPERRLRHARPPSPERDDERQASRAVVEGVPAARVPDAKGGDVCSREELLASVWGLHLRSRDERRRRLRAAPAEQDRRRARSRPCATSATAMRLLRKYWLEAAWVVFAPRERRRDVRDRQLGDDPVPPHLGQPRAALLRAAVEGGHDADRAGDCLDHDRASPSLRS